MYINNKRQITGFIILLILLILPSHIKAQESNLDNLVIFIDAGHGGSDFGCFGYSETKEKDITLNLTKRLENLLKERTAAKILLTRSVDKLLSTNNRASFANNGQGDIFISLHANASFDKKDEGLLIYYSGYDAMDTRVGSNDKDTLSWELVQFPYIKESKRFAECIADEARLANIWSSVAVKSLPLNILEYVAMPAVLIEAEFITSSHGEQRVLDKGVAQKMSESFYRGIINYFKK